jgi:hypothetical protein
MRKNILRGSLIVTIVSVLTALMLTQWRTTYQLQQINAQVKQLQHQIDEMSRDRSFLLAARQ